MTNDLLDDIMSAAIKIDNLIEAANEALRRAKNDEMSSVVRQLDLLGEQLSDIRKWSHMIEIEAEKLKNQHDHFAVSVGGNVSGEMNVAGRDVIKASPGELRTCPACGGEGRFIRMENGERLIILCDRCNGLGQIRL